MGVPLLVPLVVLVFLAAFVPLVGILVAGTLAVAVTLATRGWVAGLVLVAIFILEKPARGPPAATARGRPAGPLPPARDHLGAGRRRGRGRHRRCRRGRAA